jgi:hypothetical protein
MTNFRQCDGCGGHECITECNYPDAVVKRRYRFYFIAWLDYWTAL